jgi:putative ABC transport system permease protein
MLGIQPVAGRAFNDEEERPGAAPVAMIGEGLWRRRFGADRALIGHALILNGISTTVVGIAPASLSLIASGDVFTPLTIDPSKEIRLNHWLTTYGRLKPGVSIDQAQADMNAVSIAMGRQYPEISNWSTHIISLFDTFVGPELKTGLWVLMCAVFCVLLIACANIANLLLARAASRQSEMAIRTALGAGRRRLIRQMLIESVVLCSIGGVAGLGIAVAALRLLNNALPANTLPIPVIEIDGNVAMFAFGLTVLTGLLFGIAPAWRGSKINLNDVIKHGGRGLAGTSGARLRNTLAAVELALATVLLIGAGLLIQSLSKLQRVQLGFVPNGLITFQLSPPAAKYPDVDRKQELYRTLIDSLQTIPGVRGAAVSSGVPFGVGTYGQHPMVTTDQSVLPHGAAVPIDWRIISPGYFSTMGIPLVRGRDFTDADNTKAPPVTIVSQDTARKFWGDDDPIGHTLRPTAKLTVAFKVVGVVGDIHDTALNQQTPTLYWPMAARALSLMDIVVKTDGGDGNAEAALPAIRRKIHELDPDLAVANVRTMDEWVSNSAAQPRLNSVLLGVFAAMALLIASIGIYGVLAYSVSQRTGEIGVRMALGATPSAVLRLIVGEGMKVALFGIAVGLVGALALTRIFSSLVFGVPVRDPGTFAAVAVALACVALAASSLPALRAARVDPMAALRHE